MDLIDREQLKSTIRKMVEIPNETRAQVIGAISRAKAIEPLANCQQWNPASEPPKDNTENQWVIYKVGGSYFHTTGYYDGKCWRSAITDFKIQIVGWMPLPEPPKGE